MLFNQNSMGGGGYPVNNSLRFRASASAYLSRTPASAGNRTTWTWSAWVKRGSLGTEQFLFTGGNTNFNDNNIRFNANNTLTFNNYNGVNADAGVLTTSRVFRDPSAWYHIVAVWNTTTATAADRMQLWINGVRETAFSASANPVQNQQSFNINNNQIHNIGRKANGATSYFDGYMTEINFIDGQALTPSSFGSTNATTGVWQPAPYSGTRGTNGFYLKFSDIALTSGSNTGLGKDFSGNGNYFNTTNISVTAGVTYDAMTDSPTLTSATVGNYPAFNSVNPALAGVTLTWGNLRFTNSDTVNGQFAYSTFGTNINTGTIIAPDRYYFEATDTLTGTGGIASAELVGIGNSAYRKNGQKADLTAYGASYTTGDVIGVAVDRIAGTITYYKNNVSQGAQTGLNYLGNPRVYGYSGNIWDINFGQRPFTYTPPSGYVALNTYNLPDSTIVKGNSFMDATTYTGTGASLSITNAAGFRPDFVWVKGRSGATDHALYDAVRGTTNDLVSNSTAAETTQAQGLTAFNSNGFTVGTLAKLNTNTATYVGWQWQAGSSTVTNTSGTISSQVRANTTTGFSIVTYTGTGANATVGHGLGVAPSMVIVKRRNVAQNWQVRHTSIAAANSIQLNLQNASAAATTVWNSTLPTSTVFSIGTSADVNANTGTYVAYCWAQIAGFSAFGSYTGNGSTDGPFVYLGFRPKFVMIKNSSAATSWTIFDSVRFGYNLTQPYLVPNTAGAEGNVAGFGIDILSNGFKPRTADATINGSTNTHIYMAFAENPFKNALAR